MKTKKGAGGLGVGKLVYDADIYDGLNTYTGDVPFYSYPKEPFSSKSMKQLFVCAAGKELIS